MTLKRYLLTAFAVIGLMSQTGCVTQRAVEQIVAESNAAMVAPYLERPGADTKQPGGWEDAIKKMDTLIEQYPDQAVIVNQLRVRQAMLLTVNKKIALAGQRWGMIDRGSLKTERDKALYDTSESLVWAYKSLSEEAALTSSAAQPHIDRIDKVLEGIKTPALGIYFHTIRALIQLKVASWMDEGSQAAEATTLMVDSLSKFVGAFTRADQQWVQQWAKPDKDLEMSIGDFRERIWLRDLIRKYREEAAYYGYEPQWDPTWIGNVPLN